jgi:hypothetical protein
VQCQGSISPAANCRVGLSRMSQESNRVKSVVKSSVERIYLRSKKRRTTDNSESEKSETRGLMEKLTLPG